MILLAIDPGNIESGYALIDVATCKPLDIGKITNDKLRERITYDWFNVEAVSIEMIASYGMSVGQEIFDTCVWIGRFFECAPNVNLVYRRDVKLHHCHSTAAKDTNVTQALIDRFAMGQPNRGKGTKANPGWFYGFKKDIWQAFALAVYSADILRK